MIKRIKSISKKEWVVTILIVILLLLSLVAYYYLESKDHVTNTSKIADDNRKTSPITTENLYKSLTNVDCDNFIKLDVSSEEKEINSFGNDIMSKYVFSLIEQLGELDKINKSIFREYAINLYGKETGDKVVFDTLVYNGIEYKYSDFSKKEISKCNETNYVSKLYGISYLKDYLFIDISVGKKDDKTVYNLDGKELGSISEVDSAIAKSDIYRYVFTISESQYYLNGISLIKLVANN